jgi:peptidyl-prolyl cis-trans isomerase C
MSEKKVLATVNDIEITSDDVNGLLRSLGPQKGQQFQSEEGQKTLLNEIINQNLFLIDAKENGIDKDEIYLHQIEKLKANVLSQYAIQKTLNTVSLADNEARKYYDENAETFKEGAQVKASHVLLDDEVAANKVYKEIVDGLSFTEAANKYSKCPTNGNGGDLGFFTRGKMVQEFEDAAFSLDIGAVCKPVKTQFGYHIITVTDKKDAAVKTFEEIKPTLEKQLLSMKQNELYLKKCKDFKEKYDVKIMS